MRRCLLGIVAAAVMAVLGAAPAAASDPTLILVPGTKAVFSTSVAGSASIACGSSTISLTTTAVTAWTMGNCTSNLPHVTGVPSVTFNGLPYAITSAATGILVIHNVSLTVVLALGDLAVSCGYAASTIDATSTSSGTMINSLTFSAQRLDRRSGATVCPVALFFSARYGPGPV